MFRLIVISAALSLSACSAVPQPSPPSLASSCQLTFSDDFDGKGRADRNKWTSQRYNRRPNDNGPDGYWLKKNARLDGEGNLIISANQIPNKNDDSDPHDFASGMVSTEGKFEQLYGRFEVRARLPQTSGWWAAFWLYNDSGKGEESLEIDIMEGFGWTDQIRNAYHQKIAGQPAESKDNKVLRSGIRDGFHKYRLDWSATELVYYVDDDEVWRQDATDIKPMALYVKITGEVSTQDWLLSENWAGALNSEGFKDNFVIDYVKVWKGC